MDLATSPPYNSERAPSGINDGIESMIPEIPQLLLSPDSVDERESTNSAILLNFSIQQ